MGSLLYGAAVPAGCAGVFGVVLLVLLFVFQAPLGSTPEPLAHEVWAYLLDAKPAVLISNPQLDTYTERHLLDVKHLLRMTTGLTLLALGLAIAGWSGLRGKRSQLLRHTGQLGLSFLGLVVLSLVAFGFRQNFIWFHAVFFCRTAGGLPGTRY